MREVGTCTMGVTKGVWCEGGGYMYTGSEGESMREVGTCTLGVTKGAVV